ncbi:hypothetical protein [Fluviispira multicolorata]|uniref:Uncharacterized protein n=1 Tax=Fluviispira multicolorata TaxID=2654512 RepID=A0A833JDE8_9BACT|nr:hypothetical protein [Fluviispira multicolorata]KAB8030737.1 hypothetical protein GCL57_07125 [Fluviispira multicolorata]
MFSKNYLKLKLFACHPDMEEKEFGKNFLEHWLSAEDDLRPEEFFFAEGVKKKFLVAELGIEGLVKEWPDNCSMFRRKNKPKLNGMIGYYHNNENVFTVFFSMGQNSEYMIKFFKLLFPLFKSYYGNIQSSKVIITRYEFTRKTDNYDSSHQYGDIISLYDYYGFGITIPQISWVNFLGKELVERIGEDKFKTLTSYIIEKINDGYFIVTHPSHRFHGTPEGYAEEERIMQHLGRHHFFDRNLVDQKSLWSDHSEELVQQIIDEKLNKN